MWDYVATFPYERFFYDNWYFTSFEAQNIYQPWYYYFGSPGNYIYQRRSEIVSIGRTFDSVSTTIPDPCDIGRTVNLDLTALQFIGKCCKGSVKDEFPGELFGNTVRDISNNRSRNDSYKTAWKLISRREYRKF
jgi:hypothetical protein